MKIIIAFASPLLAWMMRPTCNSTHNRRANNPIKSFKATRRRFKTSALLFSLALLVFLFPGFASGFCMLPDGRSVCHAQLWTQSTLSTSRSIGSSLFAENSGGLDFSELKESIDIVDVVESFDLDQFQRKGYGKATAICPFHNDKNPSLSIDTRRGIYKCFSCGAGGDVFRFVQEYGNLQGEDISFYEAAVTVNQQFGDGTFKLGGGKSESSEVRKRKERLLLANAAASMFYSNCLTEVQAGGARTHLRDRGISAPAILEFGIGYAPDAYYGFGNKWGEGSLSEYLQGLNFTAQELVDAGLAIKFNKSKRFRQSIVMDTNEEKSNATNQTSFESIMDRFRDRFMVPILDTSGKRVLGFGGRILNSTTSSAESGYQPPKYLNSPESLVFSKRNVLFGHELARRGLEAAVGGHETQQADTVVLVEGYMDAISLWNVGVRNVGATMGTAISLEQLSLAAKLVGGGKIILCMDRDDAGHAAVERLCANGILGDLSHKSTVDVRIASLPNGAKDPADFVELKRGKTAKKIAKDFEKEVIQKSVEWKQWYLDIILDTYDSEVASGSPGSFAGVFGRVGSFLGTISNAGDRTRFAYLISSRLAGIMAKENGSSSPSAVVQTQLESDLISLASRTAESREIIQRRSESLAIVSQSSQKSVLNSLTTGQGPSVIAENEKFSRKNTKPGALIPGSKFKDEQETDTHLNSHTSIPKRRSFRRSKRVRSRPVAKSLTPHFSGFDFLHQSDAEWLGLDDNEWGRKQSKLTLVPRDSYFKGPEKKPVYFNSNEYHGQSFLSDEAKNAGYENRDFRPDPSFLSKGVGSLVVQDSERMVRTAEEGLLKTLVKFTSTRSVIKNMLDARNAINSALLPRWTSPEREFLFVSIVEKTSLIPSDAQSGEKLRSFLYSLEDCPRGSFGSTNKTIGSLDMFFEDDIDADPPTGTAEEKSLAAVQELWSSLLLASTARYAGELRERFVLATHDLQSKSETNALSASSSNNNALELSRSDFQKLGTALQEQTRLLSSLMDSSSRLTKKLMDESISEGTEGKMLPSVQTKLAERLDEFLNNVDGIPSQPSADSIVYSNDADGNEEDEPYETSLERMAKDWGDWADDDYSWSIDDTATGNSQIPPVMTSDVVADEDDDGVSLEEDLQRISEEWTEWEDEINIS